MIDITKKYRTRAGYPVTLYVTDMRNCEWPVLGVAHNDTGDESETWTIHGRVLRSAHEHRNDLVEITPYDGWEIDDPIYVCLEGYQYSPAHFAGVSPDGLPYAFASGGTSHTTTLRVPWAKAIRKEDYKP